MTRPFDKEEPEVQDLGRFTSEFNGETDRGAALVAAARLDEVLGSILRAYFRDGQTSRDLLDGFNAPLGTFAARASACHALALLEDHEFDEIAIIRKVRNRFGHEWSGLDFDASEIKAVVERLPWLGPAEYEQGATVRARFNAAVVILLVDLMWRERLVRGERVTPRTWPNKARAAGPTFTGGSEVDRG